MGPIMLASDGFPAARAATAKAIELARSLDAPLLVTCVEQETMPASGYYGYGQIASARKRDQQERIAEITTAVMAQAELHGVPCEPLVLSGIPGEQICRAAQARHARMIVLGAYGGGRLGRLSHDSVSTHVLNHATVPVLVVPAGDPPAPREHVIAGEAGFASKRR